MRMAHGHACVSSLHAASNTNQPSSSTTAPPEPCPQPARRPEPVLLQAETLEYLQQAKRVVPRECAGHLRYQRLFADQLELHTDTTRAQPGACPIITADDDLEASRMDFDLNTSTVLYDTTGKAPRSITLG